MNKEAISLILSIVWAVIISFIKLFTAIMRFPDDAYAFYVIKAVPSLHSTLIVSKPELASHVYLLFGDENTLLGEIMYNFVTDNQIWPAVAVSPFMAWIARKHYAKTS